MADGTRPRSVRDLSLSSDVNGLLWTVDVKVKLEKGRFMFCLTCCLTSSNVVLEENCAMLEDPSGRRNLILEMLLLKKEKNE